MTTEHTDQHRPVSDHENLEVKGAALCAKRVRDSEMEKIERLRKRQEEYHRSLPKDAIEAFSDICSSLKDEGEIDGAEFGARAALAILNELSTKEGALGDHLRREIYWLTTQGLRALDGIEAGSKRARHIASQFHPMHEPFRA